LFAAFHIPIACIKLKWFFQFLLAPFHLPIKIISYVFGILLLLKQDLILIFKAWYGLSWFVILKNDDLLDGLNEELKTQE
jgi:hypothetical protein